MPNTTYEILVKLLDSPQAKGQIGDLTAGLTEVGKVSAATGVAITALLAVGANTLQEQDAALRNLATLTGSTVEDLADFKSGLNDVQQELGFTATQADLLTQAYDLQSVGIDGTEEKLAILTQTQKTALAGQADITDVTKATIAGLGAYGDQLESVGDEAAQAARIQELLFLTQQKGFTTVGQLASQYGRVAALAASAGVPIEELSASLAAATKSGQSTEQATTGLIQTLSVIARGGATAEAKELIEEFGLSFDGAALEAEGLRGVIRSLVDNGVTDLTRLNALTGSTEAATLLAGQIAEFETFNETLEEANGNLNQIGAAYETVSEGSSQKLAASLNLIQENLAKLAAGAVGVAEPLIDAFNAVLTQVNQLPEPLLGVIGLLVGGTGVALGLSGALLLVVGTFGQTALTIKAGVVAFKSLSATLGVAIPVLNGTAGAFTTLKVAALSAAPALLPLAAAVGVLTAAYLQYQNVQRELRAEEAFTAGQEIDGTISNIEAAVNKIRSTGEALPTAEFEALKEELKAAGETANLSAADLKILESVSGTLTKVQAQNTEEVKKSTSARKDSAESIEAEIEAIKTKIGLAAEELNLATAINDNDQALGLITEVEQLERNLAAQQEYTSQVVGLNNDRIRAQNLEGAERRAVLLENQQLLERDLAARLAAEQQIRDIQERQADTNFNRGRAEIETLANDEVITEREKTERILALETQRVEFKRQLLQESLDASIEGSANESRLLEELAQLDLGLSQLRKEGRDLVTQEAEKAAQAEADAAKEAAEAQKQALEDREQQVKDFYAVQRAEQENAAQAARDSLSTQADQTGTAQGFVGDFSGLLDATEALREAAAQDDIITNEEKQNIREAEEATKDVAQSLKDIGIISGNVNNLEGARQAIAQANLNLKLQEIDIQREQLKIETQIAALEQQGVIAEQQALLNSGALNDQERALAQAKIQGAQQQLGLLENQLRLRQQNLEVEEQITQAQATVGALQNGLEAPESRRRGADTFDSFDPFSGSPSGGSAPDAAGGDSSLGSLEDVVAATEEQLAFAEQSTEAQLQGTEAIQENTAQVVGTVSGVIDGVLALQSIVSGGFGEVQASLGSLKSSVDRLPGAIASKLPRPTPRG